ncbi:nucleotidyltransferase family protein [Novosphingobium bradum]|uniref:Nucleotidyltransferase family protein n=1 Tax=Novosphingobium bradum TaxID=1737444 RepID=A0ABV7IVD7_9SPHN
MARGATGGSHATRRRLVLIGLLAEPGARPAPAWPDLSGDDWREIDRMAQVHRLQPLLHHRQQDNPAIPRDIRAGWREAFRESALWALQVSGELAATHALLDRAGLAPVALKGAWLAWHAYPHPALRPLRDIDLWLPADQIIAAYGLLREQGYQAADDAQLSLDQSLRLDKHLPPLVSPRGVLVELHHRLWEIPGRMDHGAPLADQDELRDQTIRIGPIAYLDPQDTLAHLIIHAVYDHRLDCGPLLLADIAFLLARTPIDWDRFARDARKGGWLKGAALVLDMVRDHAPHLALPPPLPDCPAPPGIAADLLLQELDTRQSAGVIATLRAGGLRAFVLRILARRADRAGAPVARDLRGEGGFAAWATTRLARTLRELSRSEVRGQSRRLATLSRWLDS